MRPETRYAKSGGLNVAYQVVGEGRFDLLHIPGFDDRGVEELKGVGAWRL